MLLLLVKQYQHIYTEPKHCVIRDLTYLLLVVWWFVATSSTLRNDSLASQGIPVRRRAVEISTSILAVRP